MDVLDAIHARRTVGTCSDQPVGRDIVARLIDAAARAPNHHETRPWHFSVLAGEARREMADAVAASLSDAPGAARAAKQKLLRAPVVVVVAQRRGSDDPTIDLLVLGRALPTRQELPPRTHSGVAQELSA